ncbi:MAG: glycosyltransferase family 4 protein [Chloroflexota bacterium]
MRLLIINSEYPPIGAGAGNASSNLARRLVESGNEVVVVTAGYSGLATDETRDGVRILRGPTSRKRVDRSTAIEQVVFMIGSAIRCLALMRSFRPQVVLAFFGLPSGAVAWFLRLMFGIPYVVSLRGGDVPGFRPYDFWLYHKIAVPFLRIIWHDAAAVVANSQGLRDLAKAFDPSAEIAIVPNGVDCERFWPPGRRWSTPTILSVGRIVHQKGFDLALIALAGVRDLPWEWRIAGDGPQLGNLKETIVRQGLQDRVHFLGWTDVAGLIKEYQGASLFLFPSRHEGMPNALLEAMASGLPVIASRIAGNEELVVPGETGVLVAPEDADALRESLRTLLTDEGQRQRMGRAARTRVAENYGWAVAASQYQRILEAAIR